MIILYLLAIATISYLLYELIFWITHRNPLTEVEIQMLAEKRRIRNINGYYTFSPDERTVSQAFKSNMRASGKTYSVNEHLSEIPALAAALLKYKKHEWIIIAFEKDASVMYLWINKGNDNVSANLFIDLNDIVEFSLKNQVSTVLMFHNHPNSNPKIYDCRQPSQIDLNTAEKFCNILGCKGINHIAFVCERGRFYRYYYHYAASFKPVKNYIESIRLTDSSDKRNNYRLHREIRKSRRTKYS